MEDEISEHSTNFCWEDARLPTTYCTIYYGLKRMKEEHGLLMQQKKNHVCSRK
jgi:hypothetical protein